MAAEGFRIAQAFVEIETDDNTARGLARVTSSVKAWGAGLSESVVGTFSKAFRKGTDEALDEVKAFTAKAERELEDLSAAKLQLDADTLRAEAKIEDLKKLARETTDSKIKLQAEADTAAAEAKLVLLKRKAKELEDRRTTIKIDLDRAATQMATKSITGFMGLLQQLGQRGAEAGLQIGSSLAAAVASGSAMTTATGGLNILVGVLLALVAVNSLVVTGFTLLAPALLLAGGAAGAMFTAIVGGVGLFAVLKMGLSGVSDALKEFWENGEISAETLAKLAPNAQKFVTALTKLKGPLDEIKKSVQNALFKDMDTAFEKLAGQWLPALGPLLTQLSSQVNAVGQSIIKSLGNPDFVSNVKRMISAFGEFMGYIGANIGELISALGKIGAAAAPFLVEIGRLIGEVMQKFNAWITRAEESGALTSFFENAVQALKDIWAIGGSVFTIIGQIIAILFPGSDRVGDSVLGGIRTALEWISGWLSDPAHVEAMQGYIQSFQDNFSAVIDWFKSEENRATIQEWVNRIIGWVVTVDGWFTTVDGWIDKVERWIDKVKGWRDSISEFVEDQKQKWEDFRTGVTTKIDAIQEHFEGLPGKILNAITGLPAAVIGIFASLASSVLFNVGFMIGAVVGFFLGLPGKVISAISGLPSQLTSFWTGVKTSMTNTVSSAVEAVRNFFAGAPGKISSALSGVKGSVTGAFSGAASWLVTAGGNILSGLTSGISGAIGAAVDAAKSAAASVVAGVKAGLGINSPSTVMRDEVGRWIPPGIVQGVTAAMPAAVRTVGQEVQNLAQLPTFGHAEASAMGTGEQRPAITISMAGANFYGVGSAREFVADMYDELDRYQKEYR